MGFLLRMNVLQDFRNMQFKNFTSFVNNIRCCSKQNAEMAILEVGIVNRSYWQLIVFRNRLITIKNQTAEGLFAHSLNCGATLIWIASL